MTNSSAPPKDTPLRPEMTPAHVEAFDDRSRVMTHKEQEHREFLLSEIEVLVRSLASGELVTVPRRELEQLNRALFSVDIAVTAAENASDWTARWLRSTGDSTR